MAISAGKHIPLPYADVFNIPRAISKPFIKQVEKWIEASGTEWTVNRLKSMKLDFIRLEAGLSPSSVWIRKSSPDHFAGPLGGLQKWCNAKKGRWPKAVQFLQMYTWFYASDVTPQQEKKFLEGVTAVNVPIPEHLHVLLQESVKHLGLRRSFMNSPRSLMLRPLSSTRREPHADGRSFTEGTATLECALGYTRSTRLGWDLRSRFKPIFDIVEEGLEYEDLRDGDLCDHRSSVGKIGTIQEAGYKLRAVANPARVYQEALRPLGDMLFDLLKGLPWDCTHDQTLSFDVVRDHLSRGGTAYSVDLSGATDYFPLDLQLTVLRSITPVPAYVDLFHKLARAPWRYGKTFIRWTKGQPLGLYPSFASFALTHGLLLYGLNGNRHNNMFYVLGDDVVILDPVLNSKYRQALAVMQCPVSESKSLTSRFIAEFGGKILTPTGVISQLKWRIPSDDSFLDIVRNFGKGALRLLRPRQKKIALKVALLPEFLGGLGFNPQGLPLEERLEMFPSWLDPKQSQKFLMSYNRVISAANYYEAEKFPNYRQMKTTIDDLDQRSLALVSRLIPRMLPWYETLGTNLYTIAPESFLDIESSGKRKTTLIRYENTYEG